MIAENVSFGSNGLVIDGLGNVRLAEILKRKLGVEASVEDSKLVVQVSSMNEAVKVYRRIVKVILRSPYIEVLGFRFREILGYRFLVYLREYRDGIEKEIADDPLSEDFDIVTLPDEEGYYYSTLYGVDNINIPVLLTMGGLFAKELAELVENNPSLSELLSLKEISKNILKLERLGDTVLARHARNFEKIASIEETIFKIMAVRQALSYEIAIVGNIEHAEIQKVRRLGNGLGVYLSKNLRRVLGIKEGDVVSIRVLAGRILIERAGGSNSSEERLAVCEQ